MLVAHNTAYARARHSVQIGLMVSINLVFMGNGQNTVSRVLFRKRELTEFYGKLGEFCEKLDEFAFAHK